MSITTPHTQRHPSAFLHKQQGATLMVSLVMLIVILMLGVSLAGMAQISEKAARNERDRHIAMHAAEAALADAETDIEHSAASNSRSAIFSPHSAEGFTEGCGKGNQNSYQGLCLNSEHAQKAVWQTAGIANTGNDAVSVEFGRFTGKTMPLGAGFFPSQLPRYIIELMPDTTAGQTANTAYIYRITAIGFGTHNSTQIVLQTFYRKTET